MPENHVLSPDKRSKLNPFEDAGPPPAGPLFGGGAAPGAAASPVFSGSPLSDPNGSPLQPVGNLLDGAFPPHGSPLENDQLQNVDLDETVLQPHTVMELRKVLKSCSCAVSGKKDELVQRLLDHQKSLIAKNDQTGLKRLRTAFASLQALNNSCSSSLNVSGFVNKSNFSGPLLGDGSIVEESQGIFSGGGGNNIGGAGAASSSSAAVIMPANSNQAARKSQSAVIDAASSAQNRFRGAIDAKKDVPASKPPPSKKATAKAKSPAERSPLERGPPGRPPPAAEQQALLKQVSKKDAGVVPKQDEEDLKKFGFREPRLAPAAPGLQFTQYSMSLCSTLFLLQQGNETRRHRVEVVLLKYGAVVYGAVMHDVVGYLGEHFFCVEGERGSTSSMLKEQQFLSVVSELG